MTDPLNGALAAPWFRRKVRLVDVGLLVMVLVLNVFGVWMQRLVGEADSALRFDELHPISLILNTLAALPLLWRRRYPVATALLVNGIHNVLGLFVFISTGGTLAVLATLYTLGAYCSFRRGLAALGVIVAASSAYLLLTPQVGADSDDLTLGWLVIVSALASIGVWGLGTAARSRRAYLEELESRADRLERTRSAEVRAALAEERTRVARELHDVVAHHVSVMTVQAAAARRTSERAPERSAEAMRAVEETGRAALGEMRRIVGALRDSEAPEEDAGSPAPQPGIADLDPVLDRAQHAGLQVELTTVGTPVAIPSGVDLAVYRVVQEALTNTLKHAGRTRATVTLRYDRGELSVQVLDDGPLWLSGQRSHPNTGATADDESASGQGLVGMRERVHLNGGTLRTGPRARAGGYEVCARFPLNGFDEPSAAERAHRGAR